MHPLANIAFMLAGGFAVASLAFTVKAYWSAIRRALKGEVDALRDL